MALLSQDQIASQMVAQLRILDPSISGEIGTPERKIIDTVAEALAEAQIDLNLLGGALDLDSKFGSDLDSFVGLFGFGRQQGAFATGFVTFSRPTPATYDIIVSRGNRVQGTSSDSLVVIFQTSQAVTLAAGQTRVIAPIQALLPGVQGNLAANTITQFANVGTPVLGITSLTNEVPTSNGSDQETDPELKVRFRNTVFRNLAGTEDQYLALAVSTQFTTKANVIGPISRYQEYMQIPLVDDATAESGQTVTLYDDSGNPYYVTAPLGDGSGNASLGGTWTTTPSNNSYAKYIYQDVPYFASNGGSGLGTVFFRQDTDFVMNAPPANFGDTYREASEGDIQDPSLTPTRPNFTFFNVYTGSVPGVALPRPIAVVLVEYSYLSTESRNDISRNITNCVDVYINGENPITADAIIPLPPPTVNLFTNNPTDKFYYQNFRRIGKPDIPPTIGHIFTALFWQPLLALPDQITVGANTYFQDIHYWAVEDKTLLGNTVRSRNGIEWDQTLQGATTGDPNLTSTPRVASWTSGRSWAINDIAYYNGRFYTALQTLTNDVNTPNSDATNWLVGSTPFTGNPITSPGTTSISVTGYTYDKNIIDLQAALEGSKQITTDVLAHRASPRYFKLDLTVVYASGANMSSTNAAIETAITNYFAGQYLGAVIQLSDILVTIRNITGVQNVRWTNDVVNPSDDFTNTLHRVTECDIYGNIRGATFAANAVNGSNVLTGALVSSGVAASGQTITTSGFPLNTRITNVSAGTITLSEDFTGTTGSILVASAVVFDTDFTLKDSELPNLPTGQAINDTLPGLIIRPRAQNTFNIV